MPNQSSITINKEYEYIATIEELEFIFSQSEKLLIETIGSGESALSRSTILLSVLIAIATSEIGYLISAIATEPTPTIMIGTVGIVLIYNLFVIFRLAKNLYGQDYIVNGSQPKFLLNNWYYKNVQERLRLKSMMIQEIKSYQDRIEHNQIANKKRWSCFELTLTLTLATPPLFILVYTVFTIFL